LLALQHRVRGLGKNQYQSIIVRRIRDFDDDSVSGDLQKSPHKNSSLELKISLPTFHTQTPFLVLEHSNGVNKLRSSHIIHIGSNISPIHRNHVLRSYGIEAVHRDGGALLDAEDAGLAPFAVALRESVSV
jgi:hypothetical protein